MRLNGSNPVAGGSMDQNKRSETIDALYNASYILACEYLEASEIAGEQFHPFYKKDKKLFSRLIRSTIKTERGVLRVFQDLYQNIWKYIDWMEYQKRVLKGASVLTKVSFEEIELGLILTFTNTLDDAFEMGGYSAEIELGTTIGFSSKEPMYQRALRQYVSDLAHDVTQTTERRIMESLLRSIELGENQKQATERLQSVIEDKKRAAKIAHTETVRSFSLGRVEAGREIGARYKVWRNGQPGACPVCTELHDQKVGLDDEFTTMDGKKIAYAPAHPFCRCLTGLEM